MSCCADPAVLANAARALPDTLAAAIRTDASGNHLLLYVPDIHCASCLATVEGALKEEGAEARVNLTRRTVSLDWTSPAFDPLRSIATLRDLGFTPRPLSTESAAAQSSSASLLRAVAVAGFAAMNVMLLSISVWSGADGSTKAFFNWFSALIAMPALAYSARPFLRSAFAALRAGRVNMDVPISLAIVLATGLSLAKTISGTGETYFDAAITLTFFLLLGRLADHWTRERARASVSHLAALRPPFAYVVGATSTEPVPIEDVGAGDIIEVAAGERVPADARVMEDGAQFDLSLATGESRPEAIHRGAEIMAGALALSGPHRLRVLRPAADSYVARLEALQSAAERSRSRPARIADRAAAFYVPVVHFAAFATFCVWLLVGAGWVAALTTAIAVLVITCPCALGLAVPVVHVAACDRLFRRGLAIKDGAALERLRLTDEVIFDKTGTLTIPALADPAAMAPADLAAAAALARHSTHPVSRAVSLAAEEAGVERIVAAGVTELRGRGMTGMIEGRAVFLGRGALPFGDAVAEGLVFAREGEAPIPLAVTESLRPGAADLVARLAAAGLPVTILSGDTAEAVGRTAEALGIADWHAGLTPDEKVSFIDGRRIAGAHPLMVGDGLNDGPAIAAAAASIAPAEASDLSRTAADLVLTGNSLDAVWTALDTAWRAHRMVLQNLAFACLYNCVAVPLAALGHASPLVAAIAMSSSSMVVTLNALRLAR